MRLVECLPSRTTTSHCTLYVAVMILRRAYYAYYDELLLLIRSRTTLACGTMHTGRDRDRTRTGQDRTGQDRAGQDGTGTVPESSVGAEPSCIPSDHGLFADMMNEKLSVAVGVHLFQSHVRVVAWP